MVSEQGLALWHTSSIVKEKLVKLKLRVLDWARKSPALNLVEMLWSVLDKKSATKLNYLKEALIDHLQEKWHNIGKGLCIKLVESMSE